MNNKLLSPDSTEALDVPKQDLGITFMELQIPKNN